MLTYDLDRARQALQYLVISPYYNQYVTRIKSCIARPRTLPFKDEAEVLNELILIGRQSAKALDNLIDVAVSKRSSKADYQREFMAAKRQRDRKVIAVEELLQGRTLTLDERRRLLLSQYATWNKEKAAWLAAREPLEWDERNASLREFWAVKEEEFERLAKEVKTLRDGHERLQQMTNPEQTHTQRKLVAARKKLLAKKAGMN